MHMCNTIKCVYGIRRTCTMYQECIQVLGVCSNAGSICRQSHILSLNGPPSLLESDFEVPGTILVHTSHALESAKLEESHNRLAKRKNSKDCLLCSTSTAGRAHDGDKIFEYIFTDLKIFCFATYKDTFLKYVMRQWGCGKRLDSGLALSNYWYMY